MRDLMLSAAVLSLGVPVLAQSYDPPPPKTPDAATLQRIKDGTAKLKAAVAAVAPRVHPHEADLEVYVKAAEWIVRHQEWYTADSGKQTLAVIEQGLKRAEAAKQGKTPWLDEPGRAVARGYRSVIDGSVQPYGVIYPRGYGEDKAKKWRLDIYLHGRDSSLTEIKHLYQHSGKEAPKDQDFVQLNIYGRGNNAYRWAGEEDVFEAMDDFLNRGARAQIDLNRVVLKGFSMGGAGTWHIGLRHPDRFAVIQPGAGFTTTHGYIAKLPDPLPDYQEKCLTIYDAYRYAENAFDVPIVAYSGEIDKQRQAAENMQAELKRLGLSDRMTHVIGPGLEHKFPPQWQKAVEEQVRKRIGETGRSAFPERVRFVTYTLKNATCDWVRLEALERQYERAAVDAAWTGETFRVTTSNVARLQLHASPAKAFPKSVTIDGQSVDSAVADRFSCDFAKTPEGWKALRFDPKEIPAGKRPGVQGPIDDAFTSSFLCVIGTGKPHQPEMHKAAEAQLARFRREWDKYLRGELPVKKDTEVTAEDRRTCNLILFGDPGSNRLIAEALSKLPVRWTADTLELDGTNYDPATHLPMLVQSSPFAPNRYVVLNSGHTFHEADFKGTNALLYPRLGDYAIVKPTPTDKDPAAFDLVTAGLFDEKWDFPKK
ncbi:MAG: prolyl oligopeptidase family serine peptidase [Zavarzinella sp.]|nr:prolyl oligopeptidase family serine peptidase [Zavarzinella sp.]